MVRLVKSYFRANSLPVGGRETPDIFDSTVSYFPHHLHKASHAIDDLDSLSYASRKHDQDFINDLNTRVIVDGGYHGLPPRARRHHVVSSGPVTTSHVSRRVVVGGEDPYYSHHRGYSLPPAGYTKIGVNLGSGYDSYPSGDHRRLSLADTAVKHAHREVDRVHRELWKANQEDPYFAALKRTPIPVEKYRSVYVPRSSSVALTGLRSVTPPPVVTSEKPSYYHYYYHREQPVSDYEDGYYYRKRPLYSPISLVRCLTASPVVPLRSHSPVSSYEYVKPVFQPSLTAMTGQPSALHKVRSSSYHGPRYYRTSSSYTLPESVGQWYYKTPNYPLESSFRYGSVPVSVPHLSSYVKYSSPPPAYDYAVAPQPPYHSRVYSGPSTGSSSNYSYTLNTSGLSPLHGYYHHYTKPVVTQSYVTPSRVTRTVYSSSSSTGHAVPERLVYF